MIRRFAVAGCALLCILSVPARGVTINNLNTPTLIELPNDGNLYQFDFTIDITPTIGDLAGGFFPVVFQDSVIGLTQFDWANLVVPAGSVGIQLSYTPTLSIGCTNSPTPEVFGPLGTFNNSADTADYFFPTQNTFLGAVKIECNIVDPNAPGPPFVPSSSMPKDFVPKSMYPPGNNDLIPMQYLNTGSGTTPTLPNIPEPGTAWLVTSGLGMCATALSRRRRKPSSE
jgi:hypothetical protein